MIKTRKDSSGMGICGGNL
jgi:hypothetical protein